MCPNTEYRVTICQYTTGNTVVYLVPLDSSYPDYRLE